MTNESKDMINPGVRNLVAALQADGWLTTDSGDGKTHDYPCDRDEAYVIIQVLDTGALDSEAKRLVKWLECRGVQCFAINDENKPSIQASYDPVDNTAFLDLRHVVDDMLRPV